MVSEWLAGTLNRTFPCRNRTPVVLSDILHIEFGAQHFYHRIAGVNGKGLCFPGYIIMTYFLKNASPVTHTSRLSFVCPY